MKTLIAFIASLAASALANLPPESRDFGKIKIPDVGLVTPADHTVEDDGCGLVTITVKLRVGETWQAAEVRAKRAAEAWKRANLGTPVDFESTARAYAGKNRVHSVIRHLSYSCGCPPHLLPVPPPKKP